MTRKSRKNLKKLEDRVRTILVDFTGIKFEFRPLIVEERIIWSIQINGKEVTQARVEDKRDEDGIHGH